MAVYGANGANGSKLPGRYILATLDGIPCHLCISGVLQNLPLSIECQNPDALEIPEIQGSSMDIPKAFRTCQLAQEQAKRAFVSCLNPRGHGLQAAGLKLGEIASSRQLAHCSHKMQNANNPTIMQS